MLRVLDLFSGIGGFSLGLERTGGFKTVAFCEVDSKAQQVLKKWWPEVPIHNDVKTLKGTAVGSVDVICGGFPCQDISLAGKGAGLAGERSGLFFEALRLISETRPRWVVLENVPALRRRGLGQVLGGLATIGYDAEWHCISASSVGARIKRERIWIVASPHGYRRFDDKKSLALDLHKADTSGWKNRPPELPASPITSGWDEIPKDLRVAYGIPGWLDRLKQLGNAVVPQIPEIIGYAILEEEKKHGLCQTNAG